MRRMLGFLVVLAVLAMVPSSQAATTTKEWTFMVYLDADNNLEPDSIDDFKEMAKIGSGDHINIVVQYDRAPGYSTANGDWKDTRRFLIKKGDTPGSTPLEKLGELNMGSRQTFTDFVTWAVTNYPARKYALVLWNHGGGWRRPKALGASGARSQVRKAICWDETSSDACLYMADVQQGIKSSETTTGKRIHLVGFDACLMGMVEVATDMKGVADVMVGSEEVEPGGGWPYGDVLGALAATPTMPARDLASLIVDKYVASYKGVDGTVTQSAIDLSRIDALDAAIKSFVTAARQWTSLKSARTATRTYSESAGYPHADLGHFMSLVKSKGVTDPTLLAAAAAVSTALKQAVINAKNGSSRANSNGLAIFFPKTKTDYTNAEGAAYAAKDFNVSTGWNDFLLKYFNPPNDDQGGGTTSTVDGTGKAKFSRTTAVPAGSTLRSVTLTFTAEADLSGGQVVIAVPSGWSAPAASGAGAITVTNGSGAEVSYTLSGQQIIVSATSLAKGKTFKVAYKNAAVPTKTGSYTFTVSTCGKGGSLKAIASSPSLEVGTSSSSSAGNIHMKL